MTSNNVWDKKKLSEIADVRDGTHDSPKPSVTGYPLVTSKHIINNKIDLSGTYLISDEDYSAVNKRSKVDQYDLLLGMIGTVGEVALIKSKPNFAIKNVGLIKTGDKTLGSYIFYYLTSQAGKNTILKSISGSTQKFISLGQLRDLKLIIPQRAVQEKIVSMLSSYDELIENNEKRIKILEEMAQRQYSEWFVKFKFPGHEKIKMVDSPLGKIPEKWNIQRLDEVAKVIRGTSYSTDQIDDLVGNFYLVNLKSFNRGGGFRFDGAKYFNGEVNDEQLLKQGDIVVAVTDMTTDRAVISRPARIPRIKSRNITFSADVVKIVPLEIPLAFTYYTLLEYRFTETTKNKANGANVLHLKPQAISEYKVLIPTPDLLNKFERACGNTVKLTDKLSEENEKLTKLRDLLIPQLVTGRRELKA